RSAGPLGESAGYCHHRLWGLGRRGPCPRQPVKSVEGRRAHMSPGHVDANCISRAGLSVDKKRNGLYWSWVRAEREIVTDHSPSTSNRVAHHATATEKEMDGAAYRLPGHVQPHHYTIALDARLDVPEFHG